MDVDLIAAYEAAVAQADELLDQRNRVSWDIETSGLASSLTRSTAQVAQELLQSDLEGRTAASRLTQPSSRWQSGRSQPFGSPMTDEERERYELTMMRLREEMNKPNILWHWLQQQQQRNIDPDLRVSEGL